VLITSAGRNPRAGWGRSAVNLARLLAADGIASVRYDGRGLGDGAPLPTAEEPLYSTMALEDTATVLDALEARGYGRIVIVGACSGAWIAFHTAVADRRIVGLVAINLQRFIWKPGESLMVAMRQSVKPASFYRNNLFSGQIWKRLAKGDIDLRSIATGLVQRKVLRPLARRAQMAAARVGLQTPMTQVRRWVGALEARDVAVLFVMSDGDPSLDERAHYFGNPPAWLRKRRNVREMLVDDSDHDLTPRRARAEVDSAIRALVVGLCDPASASVPNAASTGH